MHPSLYPYTDAARKFLEGRKEITSEQLERASQRVVDRLAGRETEPKGLQEEATEYALARLLLAASGNRVALEQYAKAEAKYVAGKLQDGNDDDFTEFARLFFPSLERPAKGAFSAALADYLKSGKDLANEAVENGRVSFDKAKLLGALRGAIAERVASIKADPKKVPPLVREHAAKLEQAVRERLPAQTQFAGKYLQLPAMQKILQGVGEGRRYYGSMTLAIACVKDNLPRTQAEELMRQYAQNCSKGLQPFTEREAHASLDWAFKHPTVRLSLRTLREQQLVDEDTMRKTEEAFRRLGQTPDGKRFNRGINQEDGARG